MEFECWCDEGVQLTFFVELKNGLLHSLFDVESAEKRGDEYMSPRSWHKVKLSWRPDSSNEREVARSIDGRDLHPVHGYSSYSMQFYVEGGDAKLRNIRVKDRTKADGDKQGVEEMTEAQAVAELRRLGATLGPLMRKAGPLTREDYRRMRRGGGESWRARQQGRPNPEPPKPIARVQMAGEQFGDDHLKLLKYIPTLENVYVSNTSVTDAGIKDLKVLPRLKTLTINVLTRPAKITDAGVKELGDISTLAGLYLGGVPITEECFASLARLRELEAFSYSSYPFDAGGVGIGDTAARFIATLPRLKHLSLGDTSITDEGMLSLARLATLEDLGVHAPDITDRGLESVKRFPKLSSLHIRSDKLSQRAIGRLTGMSALRSFSIGGAQINDESLVDLAGLPNVERLSLSYNPKISDAGLQHLAPLKKLESLDINDTGITDDGLHWLTALPKLQELNISSTAVTDAGLGALKPIKTLRVLAVPDAVTKAAIERFSKETGVNFPGR
jgi:hypothetical protein